MATDDYTFRENIRISCVDERSREFVFLVDKKYELLAYTKHRVVFTTKLKNFVVKIPITVDGEADNAIEAAWWDKYKDKDYAKCRLKVILYEGLEIPVLFMQKALVDASLIFDDITGLVSACQRIQDDYGLTIAQSKRLYRVSDGGQFGRMLDGTWRIYDYANSVNLTKGVAEFVA